MPAPKNEDLKLTRVLHTLAPKVVDGLKMRFPEYHFYADDTQDKVYPAIKVHGRVGYDKRQNMLHFAQGMVYVYCEQRS